MKPPINCIIIDDEPLAVQLIDSYAQKAGVLNVLYAGSDVYQAIRVLNSSEVQLVFLDIQMPELTGIDLMEMFDQKQQFIITSAYREYALDAFRFRVIDFLLKPVTFSRFYQAVEKFVGWQGSAPAIEAPDHMFVRADRKHYKVEFDKILYIEGLKDYIRIHTSEGKIMVLENMKDILEKLPRKGFLRVHRSYIIPTGKIKLIEGNRVQMQNLDYVPVGETYRKLVADWLGRNSE